MAGQPAPPRPPRRPSTSPLPDGRTVRPAAVRLPADRAAPLAALAPAGRASPPTPSRWLRRRRHARRGHGVAPGSSRRASRTERDLPVARWVARRRRRRSTPRSPRSPRRCRRSAVPAADDPTTVADIHAAMVDGVARHRLADAGWRPDAAGRPRRRPPPPPGRCSGPSPSPDPLITGGAGGPPRRARRARRAASTATTGGCAASRSSLPRVRLVVPDDPYDDWEVRLELVDELDPGRWCTADDVWDATPLAVELAGGERPRRGCSADVVDELAADAGRLRRRRRRAGHRARAGVARARRRGRRALPRAGAGRARPPRHRPHRARAPRAGRRLRARHGHAGAAVRPPRPVRPRGRRRSGAWSSPTTTARPPSPTPSWPGPSRPARRCCTPAGAGCASTRPRCAGPGAGSRSTSATTPAVDAVTLLRLAGDGEVDAAERRRRRRDVDGRPARRAPRRARSPRSTSRPTFAGELRPYQRRGLGWLRFLDRLGLGGCLADDMGLGKTATTLAHLLDRPGPHLVVCPLSVVHNWQAEAARFTPSLRVVVHHGAERDRRTRRRSSSTAPTSSSRRTGCSPATSSTSAPSRGRRSSPTRRR